VEQMPYFQNVEQVHECDVSESIYAQPPFVVQCRKHDDETYSWHILYQHDDRVARGWSSYGHEYDTSIADRDEFKSSYNQVPDVVMPESAESFSPREDMPIQWMADEHDFMCEFSVNVWSGRVGVNDGVVEHIIEQCRDHDRQSDEEFLENISESTITYRE
jgi:hypothetical protein